MMLARLTLRFLAILLLCTVLLMLVQLDHADAALDHRTPGRFCAFHRGMLYEIGIGPITMWVVRHRRPHFYSWIDNFGTRACLTAL